LQRLFEEKEAAIEENNRLRILIEGNNSTKGGK
jgi:hypothetical protein